MIAFFSVVVVACEQALLFGQAKRASRERASEGPRKGSLARSRETRFTRKKKESLTGSVGLGGTRGGTRVMRPGGSSPIPTSYPFMYPFRLLFSGI